MGITYQIRYLEEVIKKHIPLLQLPWKILIKHTIEEPLTLDPIGFGKPLRYSFKGHRRLRVGDYLGVYRIEPKKNIVLITTIKPRKDIYEDS